MRTFSNLRKQRGISLGSLILILIILGVIGMLAIQIVPAVIEYQSIKKAIVDAINFWTGSLRLTRCPKTAS